MTDSVIDNMVDAWRIAVKSGLDGYRVHLEQQLQSAGIVLQAKEYGVYWWRLEKEKR